ncbi:riboflavin kinase [Pitangus sulphuratus]|nr:riboflavin kinase [Pitangus sulphuratus]
MFYTPFIADIGIIIKIDIDIIIKAYHFLDGSHVLCLIIKEGSKGKEDPKAFQHFYVRPSMKPYDLGYSLGHLESSVSAVSPSSSLCIPSPITGMVRSRKDLDSVLNTNKTLSAFCKEKRANFSEQVVESFPPDISTGIYYGWACVGNGDVHKMVLSIGWNPFYRNTKKSVETHIIHTFKEDFYGEILSIVIVGYIRPEKNFDSLEALISAIQEDIEEAKRQLDLPEHLKLKEDNFFHLPEGKIGNNH